jgi:hypothetical protein
VEQTFDWVELTRRNARSVQTTIGWIFWDPGAVARYELMGLPGPLGYIAARSAPFAGAGYDALVAALGSISPLGIKFVTDFVDRHAYGDWWDARNDAVLEGLQLHAPDACRALADFRDDLWAVVHQLPFIGRPFAASHLSMPRADSSTLDGWHAVNILREWRGDTHWGIVGQLNFTGAEASTLHNEWLNYDGDWLSKSRGLSDDAIAEAWAGLERRGLARQGALSDAGRELRQWIEEETDRRTTLPWQLLGYERSLQFQRDFEPPCELLLERVNITAGIRYQPASRERSSTDSGSKGSLT